MSVKRRSSPQRHRGTEKRRMNTEESEGAEETEKIETEERQGGTERRRWHGGSCVVGGVARVPECWARMPFRSQPRAWPLCLSAFSVPLLPLIPLIPLC